MQLEMALVHSEAVRARAERLADSDIKELIIGGCNTISSVVNEQTPTRRGIEGLQELVNNLEVQVAKLGPNDITRSIIEQMNLLDNILSICYDGLPEDEEEEEVLAATAAYSPSESAESLRDKVYNAYLCCREEGITSRVGKVMFTFYDCLPSE